VQQEQALPELNREHPVQKKPTRKKRMLLKPSLRMLRKIKRSRE